MKKFTETIKIPHAIAQRIKHDLSYEADINDIANRYNTFETSSWTAKFPDGIEMDVKLCCGDVTDLNSNPLWTEAVLFENGCQIAFTEPSDKLFQTWTLETDTAIYEVNLEIETQKNYPINVFFDMDNVLNILENDKGYTDETKPIHKIGHYFRNLRPNNQMQQLVKMLPADHKYVLGHITKRTPELTTENLYDKNVWLHEFFPEFPIDKILFVPQTVPKSEAVQIILDKKLHKTDILIDDYNPNLIDWQKAGGTAIKYINDDNTIESFDGPYITKDMNVIDIQKYLLNVIYGKPSGSTKETIVVAQHDDGCIADLLFVKNYDEHFDQIFETYVEEWYATQEKFEDYVYKKLKEHDYEIKILEYESVAAYI